MGSGRVRGVPAFTECLTQTRRLASWAVSAVGDLYGRLCPTTGGSPVDGHMAVVVLALAMHDAAYRTAQHKITALPLADVAVRLQPERATQLRSVRPQAPRAPGQWQLRATDVARLADFGPAAWKAGPDRRPHALGPAVQQTLLGEGAGQVARRPAAVRGV